MTPSSSPNHVPFTLNAIAGTDYSASIGSLLIPAWSTSGIINVPILGQSTAKPTGVF